MLILSISLAKVREAYNSGVLTIVVHHMTIIISNYKNTMHAWDDTIHLEDLAIWVPLQYLLYRDINWWLPLSEPPTPACCSKLTHCISQRISSVDSLDDVSHKS